MTVFVINLLRRPDRLTHMRNQLTDFECVEAVDGETLVDPPVNRFRFWCSKGYGVKPGEIGCALSHQKIWRLILERDLSCACVLEDDVTLSPDFSRQIEELRASMETEATEVLAFAMTTAGYLINRRGAERMLKLNLPIRSTADDWVRWQRGGLVFRKVDGLLTSPKYGDPTATGIAQSDIIGDARHFVANMSMGQKALYRCGRVFGKVVDCLWR